MSELADLSAASLLELFRSGGASPVEVVASCIQRIEAVDPIVNAVATLCADQALDAAKGSEKRWVSGEARPLEGLPMGVKDLIETEGIRTMAGSAIYSNHVPKRSAEVVLRAESAGALLLAKLHTFEFARGDDSHNGLTRNPWDLERTAGASSAGPGAALAAREVPLALATDTGGSIRVPATASGVCGLKPTLGLIPTRGVLPQSWTLDHVGPMARTVEDIGLLFRSISVGSSATNGSTTDAGYPAIEEPDRIALRVGVPEDWFFDIVDSEMAAATDTVLSVLRQAGATLSSVRLRHSEQYDAVSAIIIFAEFASLHEVHLERLAELGTRYSQQELTASFFVGATDYLRALRFLRVLQSDFEAAFDEVDALVVPGLCGIAPKLDDLAFDVSGERYEWGEVVARMTVPFNLVGVPALALPTGLSRTGLPVGVQIAAPPFREDLCLAIGRKLESTLGFQEHSPAILTENLRLTSG